MWVSVCELGVCNVTEDFGVEINKELSFRYAVISSMLRFMLSSRLGILSHVAHTVKFTELCSVQPGSCQSLLC